MWKEEIPVIKDPLYCNLATVEIPDQYIQCGLTRSEVSPIDFIDVDDEAIITNVYEICDYEDKIKFYDEACTQIDPGAKCSVTNMITLLNDVIFFSKIPLSSSYERSNF